MFFEEFTRAAPTIAEVFVRRHRATTSLCLLGTIRADGSPRISPMEPRIVGDHLVMVGMPGTRKYRDLERDPRFCLHTGTVDPQLTDGDAKLWGRVVDRPDPDLHERFLQQMFEETGYDMRDETFDPFYVADLTSASSIALVDGKRLEATIWKAGEEERVVVVDEA